MTEGGSGSNDARLHQAASTPIRLELLKGRATGKEEMGWAPGRYRRPMSASVTVPSAIITVFGDSLYMYMPARGNGRTMCICDAHDAVRIVWQTPQAPPRAAGAATSGAAAAGLQRE